MKQKSSSFQDAFEQVKQQTWGRGHKNFRFPPPPACHVLCNKNIRRFHFSCLTCWERRYLTNPKVRLKLRRYKTVIMIMRAASGKTYALPEHFIAHGVIVPTHEDGLVHNVWKQFVLKWLLTIAQRIAER